MDSTSISKQSGEFGMIPHEANLGCQSKKDSGHDDAGTELSIESPGNIDVRFAVHARMCN